MNREVLLRVIVSLAVLGACAFAVVSLVTYDPADLAAYRLPAARPVHNRCGLVGAHLAAALLETLGLCSALLVVMALVWSVLNALGRGLEKPVGRLAGTLVLLACACTFVDAAGEAEGAMPGYGGAVGLALGGLVTRYFGQAGQWLLGVPLVMLALLMLSVDDLLVPPVLKLAAAGRRMAGRVAERRKRHRRPKRPRPAPAPVSAEADTKAFEAAQAADAQETEEVTETAEAPLDTGRPVSVGTLDHVQQAGAQEPLEDDIPTEETLAPEPPRRKKAPKSYVLPPVSLLREGNPVDHGRRQQHIQGQIEILERTLGEFGVGAHVVHIDQGPVVTRFELALKAGTKLTKVTSLSDDLAIATRSPAVRIVAPIPGKSTVGVELPNTEKELVCLRDLIESEEYRSRDYTLPLFIGKDASGKPIIGDLTRMPHLLLAGATGSGKSVCINSIITSILLTQHPDDVRLVLIDPKMVELAAYGQLPHLLTPVVTNMKRAAWILDWACKTMDERYDLLAAVGVRSIAAYNRLGEEEVQRRVADEPDPNRFPPHLPYIVIIVDELADMMMLAAKTIETSITRLAQKSRAVGLHIILATQRPSVDVITGLIKSNLPTRISFQVTSKVDSRTILDRNGAEKLLGCGDMLFHPPGSSSLVRAQGTYVSDQETKRVVEFIRQQREPDFSLDLDGGVPDDEPDTAATADSSAGDELYDDACRIVLATGRGSVSLLQRKLEIGYTRAARLVDMMAEEGIVGGYKGSKAREVVMSLEEWQASRRGGGAGPSAEEHARKLDAAAEDDVADE
ncbi:MAG: DNA translocase FtsK [Candidatus Brocadiia bacterium]